MNYIYGFQAGRTYLHMGECTRDGSLVTGTIARDLIREWPNVLEADGGLTFFNVYGPLSHDQYQAALCLIDHMITSIARLEEARQEIDDTKTKLWDIIEED